MARFELVRVPAYTGVRDTEKGETILSVHTRRDATNGRDNAFLGPLEQAARENLILDALNGKVPQQCGEDHSAYCEVRYVTIEGAGGSTRRWLSELPEWLADHPGTLVIGLRRLA